MEISCLIDIYAALLYEVGKVARRCRYRFHCRIFYHNSAVIMVPIPILPVANLSCRPHWKLKTETGNIFTLATFRNTRSAPPSQNQAIRKNSTIQQSNFYSSWDPTPEVPTEFPQKTRPTGRGNVPVARNPNPKPHKRQNQAISKIAQ